jgi:maleamate amidohydrolase
VSTHKEGAAEFFRDRGFAQAMGPGHKPAVVVIDLMNGFTDPAAPLGAPADAEIAHTNRLLEAAHAAGIPVFFTIIQYDDASLADAGLWPLKIAGLRSLVANTREVELDARLLRQPGDNIVVKKYASGFFATDLAERLQALDVDTVLVAGMTTSGCVRATAVDACQLGFRPWVVREAVGDRSAAAHDQALVDIETKYGDVVGIEEALRYLAVR